MKKTNHRSTLFALLLIFAPINITNLYAQNQGQVQFVFVDFGIYGNYQLVHSNIKGSDRLEIYNPDWMDETRISR